MDKHIPNNLPICFMVTSHEIGSKTFFKVTHLEDDPLCRHIPERDGRTSRLISFGDNLQEVLRNAEAYLKGL